MLAARFQHLPRPRSLRRQFVLALSAVAFLTAAGSLIAVYALRESATSSSQLSEERLEQMQNAQDIVLRTLLLERGIQQMLDAASIEDINSSYAGINTQLNGIDHLVGYLNAASDNVSVLAVNRSGQLLRNMTHLVAKLRGDTLQAEKTFGSSLRKHTAALLETSDPAAPTLATVLYRLRDANNQQEIIALRGQFLLKANNVRRLPQVVTGDLRTLQEDAAEADASLFSQRMKLVNLQAKQSRFYGELQHQVVEMVDSAKNLSSHLTDDYRQAIRQLADTSKKSQQWVLVLLAANLILAWQVSRYFLGRHVLTRLQQVSQYLRQGSAVGGQSSIPVQGDDEIGEMARAVEQFLKDRQRLNEAIRELEEFSYSISHDLRTPLRAIDGYSHILLDDYADKLDDEGKRLIKVIRNNTARMGRLIDDILQFSRIGRVELNASEVDMERLAHEVADSLCHVSGQDQGQKLQVEIGHLPAAMGDRSMLRQVFVNLLSNAIKFSRSVETPRIQVGAEAQESEIIYFVKDNGVGFDMQYIGKLFGVFQRLHSMEEFEGTGIGLAIVKRIIIRHGGRVWAEGKVNEGATTYFALPANRAGQG